MATKFYFRNIACNDPKPTGEVSTDTDSFSSSPSDKNTALQMLPDMGASEASAAGTYNSASSPLYSMMRLFVSPPLLAGQTISASDTYTIAICQTESENQMNLYFRFFLYVRTASGTNAKTILTAQSDPTEEGATKAGCLHTYTGAAGNYTVARGDRLVLEVWADIRNTRATNYIATLYYNGTTEPTEGLNMVGLTGASYISFTQTLQLDSPRAAAINFADPAII